MEIYCYSGDMKTPHDLTKMIIDKGYTTTEICNMWGIGRRQLVNICRKPGKWHIDSIALLPNKTKGEQSGKSKILG